MIKRRLFFLLAALLCVAQAFAQNADRDHTRKALKFSTPATHWEEALPIGNGRIGAMVYGGTALEQIQINEETASTGSPYSNYNPEAREYLPLMRQLLFEGKFQEGEPVELASADGIPFAKGLAVYSDDDTRKIAGHYSHEIAEILGFHISDVAVHRDDLALIHT